MVSLQMSGLKDCRQAWETFEAWIRSCRVRYWPMMDLISGKLSAFSSWCIVLLPYVLLFHECPVVDGSVGLIKWTVCVKNKKTKNKTMLGYCTRWHVTWNSTSRR